jgi:hypothetical protein
LPDNIKYLIQVSVNRRSDYSYKEKEKIMQRIFSIAFLIILFVFFCTSCSKRRCEGINCFNGGVCENGKCNCPTGYTGGGCLQMDTTEIDYYNNTFTPVDIYVNSVYKVIPVGGYIAITGPYGSYAGGSANTYETNSAGAQVGLNLNWALSDSFALGTKAVYIDVPSQYFFLKITNNSSYTITEVFVNYGLSSQSLDYITIPNNGNTYDIGYYDAFTNSDLYLTASNYTWSYNLNLPFTQNQSYTFVAGN